MIFFYSVFLLAVISAFLVITSNNLVHSALFLVLTFLLSAVLLICLEVEFIALALVIVYMGAIGILFLFILMMCNLKIKEESESSFILQYSAFVLFLVAIFIIEGCLPLFDCFSQNFFVFETPAFWFNWSKIVIRLENVDALGRVLYTNYLIYLLAAGFVLFVSLLGSLMLTLDLKKSKKS
jgi:NADH-quinone oxidoreductase subunit J